MPPRATSTSFTTSDASATLTAACAQIGISTADATLIRMGENALFRLPHDKIVVRIARNADALHDASKEVIVALWLHQIGLPAAEPTAHAQPILIHGHPVTFWHLIDDSGARPSLTDLAAIIHDLHQEPIPPDVPLPPLRIFDRVADRIAAASILAEPERDFLATRLASLQRDYETITFVLPPAAVHGDAHQSNLIQQPDGTVLLIDFERFAYGPPESDLAVTATEHLIGWHTDAAYASFCDTYGFDVMTWDGFPVIRAINELKMTTWLMQNVGESQQIADEFQTRLASLHDDNAPRSWRPF